MKRKITVFIAIAALAAIAAGCGGSAGSSTYSSGSYGYAGMSSGPKRAAGALKVEIADSALGRILADNKGSTLYLFAQDKGRASTCYGACASAWPPLEIKGKPAAGNGIVARKLGTTKRRDGTAQVTYNGHPVYRYAGDAKRGDTNGEGLDQFGAEWYVLAPSGKQIDRD